MNDVSNAVQAKPAVSGGQVGRLGSLFRGKYRELAISISLLILLILAILSLNLYYSNLAQKSLQLSNVATNLGATTQQISKDLFAIQAHFEKVLPYSADKLRLKTAMDEFDSNLNALARGGQVMIRADEDSDQEAMSFQFEGLNDETLSGRVDQALQIWSGYGEKVYSLLDKQENSYEEILSASAYADSNNVKLSGLMDGLSNEVSLRSDEQQEVLDTLQIGSIVLTILMFVFILFRTIGNLRDNDRELDLARQETSNILDNVKEGLFLIDANRQIGGQYSFEMEEIFRTRNIAGQPFQALMEPLISYEKLTELEEFIEVLFDDFVIEDLVSNLNPLEEVKITFDSDSGRSVTKYLNFGFKRVLRAGKIEDILISVRDITERVELSQEIDAVKKKGEHQLELLVNLLDLSSDVVDQYINTAKRSLDSVNNILKSPIEDKVDFRSKVDEIFVLMHRLKGESSALGIKEMASKAHDFEEKLVELKKTSNLDGLDFVPLVLDLDLLIGQVEVIDSLSKRLKTNYNHEAPENDLNEWSHIRQFATKVAKELGKSVELTMSGFAENSLGKGLYSGVNNILIQSIRNALAHGVELPDERTKVGKSPKGRIDLVLSKLDSGKYELKIRDDGRGFSFDRIKEKLRSVSDLSDEQLDNFTHSQLFSVARKHSVSSADEVSEHAGRGVGINTMIQNARELGGNLNLKTAPGKYSSFTFVFPPTIASAEAE